MKVEQELEQVQKQLAVMRDIVSQCQKLVVEDGTLYILWGSLAVITSLITYALTWFKVPVWTLVVLWIVAFYIPGSFATYKKVHTKKKHVVTFGERAIGRLWLGVLFVSVVSVILSLVSLLPWQGIIVIPFSIGLVYFPLAVLLDWKPLTAFGLVWIAGGAVMLVVPAFYSYLVLDGLIVVCEIIPGILIKKRVHKLIDMAQAE
ncbi:MAG TPA: hypothetical protein PK074_12355 [Spirochaetales bacterium]|nr:hypothetical protein [Spirochaetales bacterium]HQK35507.1 hypothetical protein [Spirochaetales bacterium]